MRKVKTLKGHVIAETNQKERSQGKSNYEVYTNEEWAYGEGCRYADHETDSVKEAEEFIKGKQGVVKYVCSGSNRR